MAALTAYVFCSLLQIFLILVAFVVTSCCFCQPHGISITLLEENVYCTGNFICSSLFAIKVHEKYVYQRKRSFLCLLLLMSGDVKKFPGPTESNIQDLLNQKGLKVFHQNIRGLFDNIAKLSTFLDTHENTHIFSLTGTHINNSIPKQLFKIPEYNLINKNRDFGTHGGVTIYTKDGIPFIRRTDLEVNELECIWLEINFPNTKGFLISVWY